MSLVAPTASAAPGLRSEPARRWAAAPALLTLALFVGYPLLMLLAAGLQPGSPALLADPFTWRVVGYTVALAAVSTLLTLAVGVPVAGALHRLELPGRRFMLAVLVLPFVLPTVVVGLALRILLPGLAGSTAAVLLAHLFFNIGVVVRIVGGLWSRIDPRAEAVAATLGASPATVWRTVTWPALRPAVLSAAVIVGLFCLTSFGVVLVLGDPAFPTVEVEIYRRATQLLDLSAAAVLTLLQLALVLPVLWWSARLERRTAIAQRGGPQAGLRPARGPADLLAAGLAVGVTAALLLPLAALLLRSLRVGPGWGLDHYAAVIAGPGTTAGAPLLDSLGVSLRIAAVATLLAVGLGVGAAVALATGQRGAAVEAAIGLPLGISSVALGFGLLLAGIDGPVDWRGEAWLIPVAQALIALPLVVRAVLPVLRSIDPRLRQVAATLGASPGATWRTVDLPFLRRAALTAAGLAAAVSLGEFGATSFLVRPGTVTVPVQVVRLLGRPGDAALGRAAALSVVLVIVMLAILWIATPRRARR